MSKQNNIPKLRFPEFSGEWQSTTLGEVSQKPMYGLNTPAINYDGVNGYIRITDIDDISHRFIRENITSPQEFSDEYLLSENDLLFARTGASVGKSYRYKASDGKLYFAGFLIKFSIIETSAAFIFYNTLCSRYAKWVRAMSMRSGQPGINAEEYGSFKIKFPKLNEQIKISNFLENIDCRIEGLEKMLHLQKKYKQGIMQHIFNQTIRFKNENGDQFPDWRLTKLKEILNEHKVRNVLNQYNEVFSVAKHKGVINQLEHLGRSYAAEDTSNYKVVYPGDIIYTKSPTSDFPFGIIKQNKLNRIGIVSVLYAVFSPINKYMGYIIDAYFSFPANTYNYLNPIVYKGAKNTMNIANDTFLDGASILLPTDINEQKKIVMFLNNIDAKIEATQKQIDIARKWKKGLLQQMFV